MEKYATYIIYRNVKTQEKLEILPHETPPVGDEWVRDEHEEVKVAELIKEGK